MSFATARRRGTAPGGAPTAPRASEDPARADLDEPGTLLHEVTFVVVDLETTGGIPTEAAITEIGAVKVRGGGVLGEFQTLVDPGSPIPPFITVLTGITDGLVASAPRVSAVLPAFLEFAHGAVLVAHNAPFDVGFLQEACARSGQQWSRPPVLDTVRLARLVLTRDDVPDCKLATLARLFRAGTAPGHRALSDARATVDVLHGLIERLGACGVFTLEALSALSSWVSPERRPQPGPAEGGPSCPAVHLFPEHVPDHVLDHFLDHFPDHEGSPLHAGRSGDVRARARTDVLASTTEA